jgi:hypothetical protein
MTLQSLLDLDAAGNIEAIQVGVICHMPLSYVNNRHNYTQLYTLILIIHTNDAYYSMPYDI